MMDQTNTWDYPICEWTPESRSRRVSVNLLVFNCGFIIFIFEPLLYLSLCLLESSRNNIKFGGKKGIWKQDFLPDGSVVQWLALLPHSKKVCMFSLCLRWFSPSTPAFLSPSTGISVSWVTCCEWSPVTVLVLQCRQQRLQVWTM